MKSSKKLKILIIHNRHRFGAPSGDDLVFKNEAALLQGKNHEVMTYQRSNDEIFNSLLIKKIVMLIQSIWSLKSYRDIKKIIKNENPDIVHFHNIFPLISPSAYEACFELGIPVVQTLHDFRFLCPTAFFFREGNICEECIKDGLWKSIKHRCFKGSRIQSSAVATILWIHALMKTYQRRVNLFVCLTDSERNKFIEAGFPESRIIIKPNFLPDFSKIDSNNGGYAVFMGRLGYEKGVGTLLRAWKIIDRIPLKIIGDGPDKEEFVKLANKYNLNNVEFLGFVDHSQALELLKNSKFMIVPSVWYETFGLSIVEAFAYEKPVIASNIGAMADLIEDGETGLLFESANPGDLAEKVKWLWGHNDEIVRMGRNARTEFNEKYTPEKNYRMLMAIYEKATEIHGKVK